MSAIGSNPDNLEDLAIKLDRAGSGLNDSRVRVSSSVNDAYWEGFDAQWFRESWYGPSSSGLRASTQALHSLATLLRNEAAEQRRASDAAGSSSLLGSSPPSNSTNGSSGSSPEDESWFQELIEILGGEEGALFYGITSSLIENGGTLADLAGLMQKVSGYTRGATVVDDYFRWAPGFAKTLKPLLGNADDLAKMFKIAGSVLTVAGLAIGIADQYFKDRGKYETDEFIGRLGGRFAFDGAGAALGIIASSAAIGAFGGPIGLAVGVGVGVAWWALSEFTPVDTWVIDAGGWIGDQVGDLVDSVDDMVSDFAGDVGNAVGGAADAVGDAVDWLTPW
jgi:hypothetical protein